MLEGLFMLLSLSTIMAIASFLAGSLPLSFSMSQSRLRLVATIGMGVLVGTSLIVIIPEGVETLYSASGYGAETQSRRSMLARRTDSAPLTGFLPIAHIARDAKDDAKPSLLDIAAAPGPVLPSDVQKGDKIDQLAKPGEAPPKTPTEPGVIGILGGEQPGNSKASDPSKTKQPSKAEKTPPKPDPHGEREPHAWIGLSLVLGFILMYLLDTLPLFAPSPSVRPQSNIYSLSDLSSSPVSTPGPPQRSLSTTLGLCIHAAADGIALGASSTSSSTKTLSLIIFVAIMVHKAPAAFGLTSVLLKQGLGKRAARAHLVVFSLSAPAGALATWILVRALGGGWESEPTVMKWWTGVLLLFSGGTFLYVAMHTMSDDESNGWMQDEPQANGYLEAGSVRQVRRGKDGKNPKMVLAAVGGMLLPLLTQIGHAH